MPTPGSKAGLKSFWPTPRMLAVMEGPNEAPCGLKVTLGALSATCARLVMLRDSIIAPVTAVMATGMSCRFCFRNWAVTTTSSRPWSFSLAACSASAVDCMATAAAIALPSNSRREDLARVFAVSMNPP